MFFARVRWVGRIIDGAGIGIRSKTGMQLSTTLIQFSKYIQKKNYRGDGAARVRLNMGPAAWAVLAGMLAPLESDLAARLALALGLSDAEAAVLLERTGRKKRGRS